MAKPKPKLKRKGLIPPSILAIFVIILTIMTTIAIASAQMSRTETAEAQKMSVIPSEKTKPVTEPEKTPEQKPAEIPAPTTPEPTPVKDPNGCEAKGMWYRADNNECIPKPAAAATNAAPTGGGSGSCQAEIAKYDWGQSTATQVMLAESGGDPGIVNYNPATLDHSVGCFQVNIWGANAASRPSQAALQNAATNVEFAYRIYVGNGHSFIGQWGVCRSKVACY